MAIDQGLCFHVEPKLRTVIWDFASEPIPPELLRRPRRLDEELLRPESDTYLQLKELLFEGEIAAAGPAHREPWPWGCFPIRPRTAGPIPGR